MVVTDGNDNASAVTLENLVKALRSGSEGSGVWNRPAGGEEERRKPQKAMRALKALGDATGGEGVLPEEDLAGSGQDCASGLARDMRNQYTIGYSASNTQMDGTYRKIEIIVKAPGNLKVRTRSGYYATQDQGIPAKGVASK